MENKEMMKAYILRTKMRNTGRYELTTSEYSIVYDMLSVGKIFEAISLLYKYAMAKGYRMAKKELRRG